MNEKKPLGVWAPGWWVSPGVFTCTVHPRYGRSHAIPAGSAIYCTGKDGDVLCADHAPKTRSVLVTVDDLTTDKERAALRRIGLYAVRVEGVLVDTRTSELGADRLKSRLRRALRGFRRSVPRPPG